MKSEVDKQAQLNKIKEGFKEVMENEELNIPEESINQLFTQNSINEFLQSDVTNNEDLQVATLKVVEEGPVNRNAELL